MINGKEKKQIFGPKSRTAITKKQKAEDTPRMATWATFFTMRKELATDAAVNTLSPVIMTTYVKAIVNIPNLFIPKESQVNAHVQTYASQYL